MPTHHPADKTLMNFILKRGQDNYNQRPNDTMLIILAKHFGNSKNAAKFDKIVKVKISRP